jgi:hypothetical protein
MLHVEQLLACTIHNVCAVLRTAGVFCLQVLALSVKPVMSYFLISKRLQLSPLQGPVRYWPAAKGYLALPRAPLQGQGLAAKPPGLKGPLRLG